MRPLFPTVLALCACAATAPGFAAEGAQAWPPKFTFADATEVALTGNFAWDHSDFSGDARLGSDNGMRRREFGATVKKAGVWDAMVYFDFESKAERIRSTIADTPIALAHGTSLRMTCSIGFAPWPFSSAWPTLGDWQQTTAIADRCLYAAKDTGRDAWVGLVPGLDADRLRLQALLAGADPETLGGAVRLLHSTVTPPRFER